MRGISLIVISLSCGNLFAQGGGGLGFAPFPSIPASPVLPVLMTNTEPRSSGAGEISVMNVRRKS